MRIEKLIDILDGKPVSVDLSTHSIREAKIHLISSDGTETVIPMLVHDYTIDIKHAEPLKYDRYPVIHQQPSYTVKITGPLTDFVKRIGEL